MVLPVDQEGVATDRPDHTHSRRAGGQNVEEKVRIPDSAAVIRGVMTGCR